MLRSLLLLLATLLGLAAPPASAAEPQRLRVLLEWFVNPDHAALVIARERGLFAARGLDVELVPATDPAAPPRLLAAGEAEIAVHYQPNLMLDVAAGLPLVRFATLVETPLNTLMVLKDGPVRSIADLKGRRIGYSVAGLEEAVLSGMLAHAGLKLTDVTLVNVNFALTPALLSGSVDATIGGFRNFELTQMQIEKREGRPFYPEEHGVPPYDELILVTRADLLGDARLPRFVDALEEASLFIANHADEARDLFLRAYPDLDDALNRQAFADTVPRLAKRPGALDRARTERFSRFLEERGVIASTPPLDTYAVELTR
ncbi:ABC transporter substrate-binding protein [Aureimonas jatrophae]|uniref:Putative hydroxymethylpyrimidine transport system substrate-binding protein n=1 Tax=Aureimonas jatrophae TaxID=1166073 RepID=A0A1H0KTH5_9HYPH|nr:ABC transporter substrate-binding protein [Aureimonas jatrophae]MBB3948861.1 putative hydroxymethylpyrimidine transport system substrate-binding protein [Aureimonas jatrophae]SDO59093.1 putative hydroxymethylpyrimidine transport system substrate-binding protein [Aureimonas jatrophae]